MNRQSFARPMMQIINRVVLPGTLLLGFSCISPSPLLADNSQKAPLAEEDKSASAQEKAKALIEKSREELKDDNLAAAREYFEKAKSVDSKAPGLDKLAADLREAEREAEEEAREEQIEQLLDTAEDLLDDEKFDPALQQISKALEIDPKNEDALELKQEVEEDKAEYRRDQIEDEVEKRIKASKRAMKENNFEAAKRLEAGARDISEGLFDQDLNKLKLKIEKEESEYIAEQNEEEIERYLDVAEEQLKANRFDEARKTVSNVYQLDKNNRDANKLMSEIAEDEKEFAEERLEREIEQDLKTADRLMNAENYEEAIAAFKAVQTKDPDNRDASKGLSRAQDRLAAAQAEEAKAVAEAREKARQEAEKKAAEEAKRKEIAQAKAREEAEAKRRAEAAAQQKMEKAAESSSEKEPVVEETTQVARNTQQSESSSSATQQTTAAKRERESAPREVAQANTQSQDAAEAARRKAAEEEAARQEAAEKEREAREAREKAEEERRQAAEEARQAKEEAERKEAAQKAEAEAKRQEELRKQQERQEKEVAKQRREQAEAAYKDGLTAYENGDLTTARRRWLDAKEIDPSYTKPDTYLENTEEEYNALLADKAASEEFEEAEAAALDKMSTLIPIRTLEPTSLAQFLQNLRLLSGIDFVIAGEVNAKIEAAFEDEPLYQVLDSVLLPIGLRWRREPGSDTVIIEPDLRTEVFVLLPNQLNMVNTLIEDGVIGRLLYGPTGEPVIEGQEVYTDPRKNFLVVTDSEANLDKVRKLLESLKDQQQVQLIWDSFEIDETRGPEIKALLDAILSVDDDAPFNTERKLILEGSTLIVKDSPENIQRVREILLDQNFLTRFYQDELSVASFNLTPAIEFEDNPDLIQSFTDQVRQVVETLLYAQEGRRKAEREGRRIWYDPATKQLTIVDYPDRLQKVQNYIESLPQIRSLRRSKIYFLDHASANELRGQIEAFLGIDGSQGSSTASDGEEITKSLSVEDVNDFDFGGGNVIQVRVIRVNENDAGDENDDDVELFVRTGVDSQDITLEEFRSEFVDDFEIVAEDVRPSSTPGEGRARLTVRYVPQEGTGGFQDNVADEDVEEQREEIEEETGLSIVDIENLNALFVQYENIEELREVEFWIRTLDIPTLQVSIEIKFVEVIMNKAKEIKPEFVIADLSNGFNLSDSILNSRFAQDRDEYTSVFEPALESIDSSNLLKGATVFNYIVNNGNSPISFSLRLLESKGVINVVNGPTVTVLNTETADFIIERNFGLAAPDTTQTTSGNDDTNIIPVANLTPVDVSVEPTVTRRGNITLGIDVVIEDFDQNVGQIVNLEGEAQNALTPATAIPRGFVTNEIGTLRKELTTRARIRDGGTVVLGGWRSERVSDLESGVPILRDIPFIGKYLFERIQKDEDKITLLIFLTGSVVKD